MPAAGPPELSVVVPAYQEADTISEALTRLRAELARLGTSFEIVLVSDGCTDGTPDIAAGLGFAELRIEHYVPNRGKGHALRHGFARSRGKWLAFIDADLDIDPSSIGPLLQPLLDGNADVAVASKVHPGSSIHYPPFRRLQSKVFRTLVHTAFSLDVHDTQTGLKVFTHTVLERCLPLVRTDGFAFDVELLVLANDAGFRIVEGPVLLDYQFSSSTGAATVSDMLRELADIWRRRRRARKAGEWITPN